MIKTSKIFVTSILMFCVYYNTFAQIPSKLPAKKPITPEEIEKLKEKKFSKWSLKTGLNTSVVYLARNIKDNNNEPGFSVGTVYEINNFVRISTLYSRFRPINIEPTWLNVKANSYEANLEIMAIFPNKKTLLYPFAGLSYNTYSGFFTGEQDYLNLKEYYTAYSTVTNNWLGLNIGTGVEHNFGLIGIYFDYRMRVGKQETAFNIMDVCYTGGVKIKIPKSKKYFKSMFGTRNRFTWF